VVALDGEFAILPVETSGADHPTTFLVREGLGTRVTRVNADLARCSAQQEKKKKKLETSWQRHGLLHPVHGAIREQLQICQRAAQPWLPHVIFFFF
jgi:hypothetical protein